MDGPLKNFENSRPSASNFKSFSWSLKYHFLKIFCSYIINQLLSDMFIGILIPCSAVISITPQIFPKKIDTYSQVLSWYDLQWVTWAWMIKNHQYLIFKVNFLGNYSKKDFLTTTFSQT